MHTSWRCSCTPGQVGGSGGWEDQQQCASAVVWYKAGSGAGGAGPFVALQTRIECVLCSDMLCAVHAGLLERQREGVLDSLIGWARFAEQQDRQELLHLCIHGLALHCAAAQSR